MKVSSEIHVESESHVGIEQNRVAEVTPPPASYAPETPRSVASTSYYSPSELHLDTTSSVQLETPPQSHESGSFMPMTPSATEHSSSEFGQDLEDAGDRHENYRYLHSYALNNLNHSRPKKETILRRTTMNQKNQLATPQKQLRRSSETMAPMCFVTPEPSWKELDVGVYTPPPSRMDFTPQASKKLTKSSKSVKIIQKKSRRIPNEKDDFDRFLDAVQWHAPLILVPVAFGCWITGSVPILSPTLRFIFA